MKKVTLNDFIKKAKIKWGDTFDYSKAKYINDKTKICIIDKDGNEFWQTPSNHLYGFDCRKNKMTTELFIKKAKEVHGERYDYSKVKYTSGKDKVCIICPEHGEFWQHPYNHLHGKGCLKCAIIKTHNKQKLSQAEFIKKSIEKHQNKYDYSKVNYINNETKVCIICPEHGEFWQPPTSHMSGHGCPKCSKTYPLNNDEFIKRGQELYGDMYDYSLSDYKSVGEKIIVTCKEHGNFKVTPANFFKKRGCPECGRKFRKKEKALYEQLLISFPDKSIMHSFYDTKILGKQELDIYFPEYKIAVEYQGEQHFFPIDFGGYGTKIAERIFRENTQRDIKKKELCAKNDIKLLYYSDLQVDTFLDEKVYHNYDELNLVIDQIIKKEDEK